MAKKLTEKQERFVQEYLKNPNATEAARQSGYKGNDVTLGAVGAENLKKPLIAARISEANAKRQERTEITADSVIKEIADVAFAHLGLVADWYEEGELTLKPKDKMCERGIKSLAMITSSKSFDKDGNHLGTRINFKMNDKLKALELLSKHLGVLDGSGADKSNPKSGLERLQTALSRLGKGGS